MSPNSSGEKTGDYNLSQRWLDPRATISRSIRSLRGPILNHPNRAGYCEKNHFFSDCPVLRELVPNTPTFNSKKGHKQND